MTISHWAFIVSMFLNIILVGLVGYLLDKLDSKNENALKCKDGWYIEIKRTFSVVSESDVKSIVEMEGLNIKKHLSNAKRIYADGE